MADDQTPDLTGKLQFENDRGAGRSKWIAIFLAIALFGWMGSGYIIPTEPDGETSSEAPTRAVTVAVMPSIAQDVGLVLTAEGQATPDRATRIQAMASGQVVSVSINRGDLVEAGQEIGRLDAETIQAQLAQANAQLAQATEDLNRLVTLQERGIATESQISMAWSAKATAEAAVTQAREMMDNSIITAPFSGRLNEMTLDVGEFVNDGDVVAEVLDNDPLSIVIQVPQQALARLQKGQEADVSFITGESRSGTVGFIGSNADSQTRTFRVEIAVDNPNSEMPAGLSARVAIPTGETRGHFISPAILSLGTNGDLGVKTVEDGNVVAFHPIMIVRAQTDGIWVTGLDDKAQIITVGQGFVNEGDVVDPRPVEQEQTALVSQ